MSQVTRVINEYYDDFESYDCVFNLKTIRFWLCLFFLIMLFIMIAWHFRVIELEFIEVSESLKKWLLFSFEISFLILFFSLNVLRDNLVISRMQDKLRTKEVKLKKLKTIWLQQTLNVDKNDYLSLAKDLDMMFELRKKYKGILLPSWESFFSLIYTADSKNRILAMLIAICAATVALSISAGSNINDVFSMFHENSIYELFLWDLIVSFIIILIYVGLKMTALMVYAAIYQLSDKLKRVDDIDRLRVSLFINLLLDAHEFKKAKIRVAT